MSEGKATPPQRSLRGTIMMVVAALIVAALGFLAWSAQRPRAAVTVVRPAGPSSQPAADGRPASRPAVQRPRQARVPTRPRVEPPSPPDGGYARAQLTRNDIRAAQAQLHRAADPCVAEALKSNPNVGLRMAIRYTLYVQKGEARAVNPKITKSLIKDPQVEACVLDKISHYRWQVDSPDGVLHVAESFNFKHLMRTHISD